MLTTPKNLGSSTENNTRALPFQTAVAGSFSRPSIIMNQNLPFVRDFICSLKCWIHCKPLFIYSPAIRVTAIRQLGGNIQLLYQDDICILPATSGTRGQAKLGAVGRHTEVAKVPQRINSMGRQRFSCFHAGLLHHDARQIRGRKRA